MTATLALLIALPLASAPLKSRQTLLRGLGPKYEFHGDLARKIAQDSNRNDKYDRWEYYDERARLTKIELDTNNDGKVDMRCVVDAKGTPKGWPFPRAMVLKVGDDYKLVPQGIILWALRRYEPPPGRAEKLVDGKWTRTFTYRTSICLGGSPISGNEYGNVLVEYSDGRPKRVLVSGGRFHATYQETTYKDGLPVKRIAGRRKDRIAEVTTYRNGVTVKQERDTNGDGKIDERTLYTPKATPYRRVLRLENGKWLGTYVRKGKPYGFQGKRVRYDEHYRDGVLVKSETRVVATGQLVRSMIYRDNSFALEEVDRNLDGRIDYRVYHRKGVAEALEAGKWARDFVLKYDHARLTYRQGRLHRMEQNPDKAGVYAHLTVYVSPTETHEGERGRIHTWRYCDKKTRRLVREKRDTDGDGKADIEVDYVNLTIKKLAKKPWSGKRGSRPGSRQLVTIFNPVLPDLRPSSGHPCPPLA